MAFLGDLMRKWHTRGMTHEPRHPHLGPDPKTFEESLNIGSTFEEYVKPRLEAMFSEVNSYCDRLTTDRTGEHRQKGKRIVIQGKEYVTPDIQVSQGGPGGWWVDLKSKQYHSFYHHGQRIQQCVNVDQLDDYLTISAFKQMPVFLLFHLWPRAFLHNYGKADEARIHTGVKWEPLPEKTLRLILRKYPVDDWYYLINGQRVQEIGRKGCYEDEQHYVYYFDLAEAIRGPGQGMLPPLADWVKLLLPLPPPLLRSN